MSASVRPLQVAQVFSVTYLRRHRRARACCLSSGPRFGPARHPAWALVSYLLILSGNFVQVFCIYILGAYVGRTYLEVEGAAIPTSIMEIVGRRERQ